MSAVRALVLGGTGEVGRAVVRQLVTRGARVAFTYHSRVQVAQELTGELVAGQGGAPIALPLDATSVASLTETVARAARELGGIDALVHAVAVGITSGPAGAHRGPTEHHRITEVDEAAWDRMQEVNVKSAFFALQRVIPVMQRCGGGNVLLVASIDGVKPVPAPVHFAVTRGSLAGLTRSAAKELGPDRIKINLVCPGLLDGGGVSRTLPLALRAEYRKHCGLGREAQPDEVARMVTWMACENTYVTGQLIFLDGAL